MSDTPETDKQWANWLNKLRMPIESFVDVARKLERERNHWKSESLEQAKLLAMSGDREEKLRAQLQDAEVRALYEQRLKNTYKKLLKQ